MNNHRLVCTASISWTIGQVIIFFFIVICTIGIGLLFIPYYWQKMQLNMTNIVDKNDNIIGKVECTIPFEQILLHIVQWIGLIIITLGFAGFVYQARVVPFVLNFTNFTYFNDKV